MRPTSSSMYNTGGSPLPHEPMEFHQHRHHRSTQQPQQLPSPISGAFSATRARAAVTGGGECRGGGGGEQYRQPELPHGSSGPLFPVDIARQGGGGGGGAAASPSAAGGGSVHASAMRSAARSRYDPSNVDASSFLLGEGSSFLPDRLSWSNADVPTPSARATSETFRSYRPSDGRPVEPNSAASNFDTADRHKGTSTARTARSYRGDDTEEDFDDHRRAPRPSSQRRVPNDEPMTNGHRRGYVNDQDDVTIRGRGGGAAEMSPTAQGTRRREVSIEQMGAEQLQNRCLMLASCLEHTTTERDALSEMIANLTSYRDALLQDVFVLRETNKELASKRDGAEALVAELQDEVRRSIDELNSLRESTQRSEESAARSSSLLDALQRSNRVLEGDRDKMGEQLRELRGQLDKQQQEFAEVSRQLDDTTVKLQSTEKELLESKVIEGQMEKMVVDRDEECDREREQHSSVSRAKSHLEHQLNDALERETAMQRTLDRLTAAKDEARADLKRVIDQGQRDAEECKTLRNDISLLRARELEWNVRRETLEIQRGSAQGSSEQLLQRCQELREQVARLEVKLEGAQEQNVKLQSSETELRTRNNFVEEKCSALREAAESERKRNEDLELRCKKCEAYAESTQEELGALREELLATKEALVGTSESLDVTRRELDSCKISVAAEDAHREEMQTIHDAQVKELEHTQGALRLQLEEQDANSKVLQEFHRSLMNTITIAMSQRDYANRKLEEVEANARESKVALDQVADAKTRLTNELQHEREAQSALLQRIEQLEHILEQTNDMLSSTRQDRDLLVNEMRRSQQLWAMHMGGEEPRPQRASSTSGGLAVGAITTTPSSSSVTAHQNSSGNIRPDTLVTTTSPQQQQFHDDMPPHHRSFTTPQSSNVFAQQSTSSTPLSPVITGVVHNDPHHHH